MVPNDARRTQGGSQSIILGCFKTLLSAFLASFNLNNSHLVEPERILYRHGFVERISYLK
jgi:hypothetical protein